MGAPVCITRTDHTAPDLRVSAARSSNAAQARRLLALAMVLEGAPRADAARMAGMDRQTLRDWVHRYNEAGIQGLVSRVPLGAPAKLTAAQMSELRALVLAGPDRKSTRSPVGAASICARRWHAAIRSSWTKARSPSG